MQKGNKNDNFLSRLVAGVMNWGKWGAQLNTPKMASLIEECIALGVTSFDHADIYGDYTTEKDFGKAFKQSKIDRSDIQIITKCGICLPCEARPSFKIKTYNTSKDYIIECAENSLKKLETDYIDLLLIHRPSPLMEFEEMAEAFQHLKDEGKIINAGVSNFTPEQVESFIKYYPIVTNQIEASVLHLDPFLDGTIDVCYRHDMTPMAWSPLKGGKLFQNHGSPAEQRQQKRILDCSKKWDIPVDVLAYAFLLHHPIHIIPVTGSSRIERIDYAVQATELELTDEQWFELWIASTGQNIP